MRTRLFKKMFGECRDIQVRAVVHEHREVGQECCKKGEYKAEDLVSILGPDDLKDRQLVILPTAEWMKRSFNRRDETLRQMEAYRPNDYAQVTEHLPENERAAILFLLEWELMTDDCVWNWKEECWVDRYSSRKRPV